MAADYFFEAEERSGRGRPGWNPYIGSGQPIVFDGINPATSPTRWLSRRMPGDSGRDVLVFVRMFFWTWGTTLAAALGGVSGGTLLVVAVAATVAPYPASLVDIIFLDVDLLAPWVLVLALAMVRSFPLWAALALATLFGVLVGALGFLQAQFVMASVAGLYALLAARATHGRTVLAGLAMALGLIALLPAHWPLISNLPHLASMRDVQCMADFGPGVSRVLTEFLHPVLGHGRNFDFISPVGALLILATYRSWRFQFPLVALAVMLYFAIQGFPHWICEMPGISGIRWWRHLRPHIHVAFLFGVAAALEVTANSPVHRRRAIVALAALGTGVIAAAAEPEWTGVLWAMVGCGVGLAVCGGLITAAPGELRGARRGSFVVGLGLLALAPFLLLNGYLPTMIRSGPAPEVPPLSASLSDKSPIGRVQAISRREDRRHYAASDVLHPNWPGALGILDLRVLGALYARPGHELNSGLFDGWVGSEYPDRFVRPAEESRTKEADFQKILILNRVSLLTFLDDRILLADEPSPYSVDGCQSLGTKEHVVSYYCPGVGPIGYFPAEVRRADSTAEAIAVLDAMSPAELLGSVVVSPGYTSTPDDGVRPAVGHVLSFERGGDDLSYRLEIERAGLFVIADNDFPGWTATVNGHPTPILRANAAFKALHVPEGLVDLRLHFRPK